MRSGQVSQETERSVPQQADHAAGSWWTRNVVAFGRFALAAVVLLCGVTLVLGFANKDRCTGPEFDELGRSQPDYTERARGVVCYS